MREGLKKKKKRTNNMNEGIEARISMTQKEAGKPLTLLTW